MRPETKARNLHLLLLITALAALAVSAIRPVDWSVWAAEVSPAVIGGIILFATYRRFRLTTPAYVLCWLFALILIGGGHYTYSRVPLGLWVQDALHLSRNHYDRLGHFFQGVIPAVLARELLIRTSPLRPGKWLFFLATAAALAVSACYEFIEWWSAVIFGGGSVEFLATQGDPWDAHWDMLLATCGAIVFQLTLGRYHNRAVARLTAKG